jgi:hypothetical protein
MPVFVEERKINVSKNNRCHLNLILVKISYEYDDYGLLECEAI